MCQKTVRTFHLISRCEIASRVVYQIDLTVVLRSLIIRMTPPTRLTPEIPKIWGIAIKATNFANQRGKNF